MFVPFYQHTNSNCQLSGMEQPWIFQVTTSQSKRERERERERAGGKKDACFSFYSGRTEWVDMAFARVHVEMNSYRSEGMVFLTNYRYIMLVHD